VPFNSEAKVVAVVKGDTSTFSKVGVDAGQADSRLPALDSRDVTGIRNDVELANMQTIDVDNKGGL